jgi:hypothetical protein
LGQKQTRLVWFETLTFRPKANIALKLKFGVGGKSCNRYIACRTGSAATSDGTTNSTIHTEGLPLNQLKNKQIRRQTEQSIKGESQ